MRGGLHDDIDERDFAMKTKSKWINAVFGVAAVALVASAVWRSTYAQESASKAAPVIADVAWIGGAWQGEAGRKHVEEHWTKPAGGTMLGVGRTIDGDKTVSFEFLRIEERADGLFYVAQPRGGAAVDFKLTKLEGRTAVFENPRHDFPKVIRYTQSRAGVLTAEISGGENDAQAAETFSFSAM
jgi:hypothetical protein